MLWNRPGNPQVNSSIKVKILYIKVNLLYKSKILYIKVETIKAFTYKSPLVHRGSELCRPVPGDNGILLAVLRMRCLPGNFGSTMIRFIITGHPWIRVRRMKRILWTTLMKMMIMFYYKSCLYVGGLESCPRLCCKLDRKYSDIHD